LTRPRAGGAKGTHPASASESAKEPVGQHTFASDNYAPVHPDVLAAIAEVNVGHAASYGADLVTAEAVAAFRRHLGEQAEVAFVLNGTGANVVGLHLMLRPWEHVVCSRTAHVNVDECGAPERFLGVKLVDVDTPDGRLTPEIVRSLHIGVDSEHRTQPGVVSITQPTEVGTLYTPEEVRALADCAHELGMSLHMDGARVCNAAAALGVPLRATTTDCGVDVLSFGGTKNGLMGAEAVVLLRPEPAGSLPYVRKQCMQLGSKLRFVSAQFRALLDGDLWLRNASHANAMAARLHAAVRDVPGLTVTQPCQVNAVFATVPEWSIPLLQKASHFYEWDQARHEVRWMCSWDTTERDVDAFATVVREVLTGSSPHLPPPSAALPGDP
jgi:threonine aldolase